MKFEFTSYDDYQSVWNTAHSGILYWKKVRQDAQGKICLQVDGTPTHYDVKYATDKMIESAYVLKAVEDSTRPEWNEETETYELVTGVTCYSGIITQCLSGAVAS